MPNGELNLFQAIVVAVVQGVTELFPVSSRGHAVILGTALALLLYFWRDWWALPSSLQPGETSTVKNASRRLLLRLVCGL